LPKGEDGVNVAGLGQGVLVSFGGVFVGTIVGSKVDVETGEGLTSNSCDVFGWQALKKNAKTKIIIRFLIIFPSSGLFIG
jgi:hypothetical protein